MKNIILIGFMGSGKTTVGIRLSYRLKRTFTDTDKWIENKEKMTISEIFEHYGEEEFRNRETQCLQAFLKEPDNRIISVGGGLPMRAENRLLLKKLGMTVYLKVSPETVCLRLKEDKTRPLLAGDNPEGKVETLMRERAPLYEDAADLIIDVNSKNFDAIVNEIIEKLTGRGYL